MLFCGAAGAETLRLPAKVLFEDGVGEHVRLSDDGGELVLEWGELFEDDGPAAGYSYKPNTENLSEGVWAKKELIVPNPAGSGAILLVGSAGNVEVAVNGKEQKLEPGPSVGKYGRAWKIDPAALKPGRNEFVLRGTGKLFLARAEDFPAGSPDGSGHPNRSARSTDGGKTWNSDRLGAGGAIDGEYYVRLWLEHYRPKGTVTTGVIDLCNPGGKTVSPPAEAAGPVAIRVRSDAPRGARIVLRARSGTSYVPAEKTWTDWLTLDEQARGTWKPAGRYAQLQVELATDDPLVTPRLREIAVECPPPPDAAWTGALRVLEARNEQIVRTCVPFEYEPFDHPRLAELRRQYRLDEVVSGARGELEQAQRLAAWTSRQWNRGHLSQFYPPWDALEILKKHADGKPVGGFCQQYNIVLAQACLSLGIVARNVSIGSGTMTDRFRGGHEVAEVWSNEHRKWVFLDGHTAWCFLDEKTGVPLSFLELRERQLEKFAGREPPPVRLLRLTDNDQRKWSSLLDWPPFLELRLIPRNNYLQKPAPLPLRQGMFDWFWTGHWVWSDARLPARLLYGNRLARRGDFEWTLNQARYALEATAPPGEIRVHLDTQTPGFRTFLAEIDGAEAKPVEPVFLWKLHRGKNSLRVFPRNLAGRDGIASAATLEWNP